MESLPVEIVMHLMNFLPVQQVFVSMRVNRKWEDAARSVIRTKRQLTISNKRGDTHQPQLDEVWTARFTNRGAMGQSLLKMESLERLTVSRYNSNGLEHAVVAVIRRNASTLRKVDIPFNLPLIPEGEKYLKLEKVRCATLSAEIRALCPVLRKVVETASRDRDYEYYEDDMNDYDDFTRADWQDEMGCSD